VCDGDGDDDASDVASLARAAVNGDEEALDMFMSSKYTGTTSGRLLCSSYKHEACTFYVASDDGKIHLAYVLHNSVPVNTLLVICYLRQGGYVFVVVCLLATLRKNCPMDLHEIFIAGWQWANEQIVKFRW